MLISEKIRKTIQSEVKSLASLSKLLENREKQYGANYASEKEEIKASINYYNAILAERSFK